MVVLYTNEKQGVALLLNQHWLPRTAQYAGWKKAQMREPNRIQQKKKKGFRHLKSK
jgi:hypothetical protein